MNEAHSSPFTNSALNTILVVNDLPRSKAFYKKVLGAIIFLEYGDDSPVLKF